MTHCTCFPIASLLPWLTLTSFFVLHDLILWTICHLCQFIIMHQKTKATKKNLMSRINLSILKSNDFCPHRRQCAAKCWNVGRSLLATTREKKWYEKDQIYSSTYVKNVLNPQEVAHRRKVLQHHRSIYKIVLMTFSNKWCNLFSVYLPTYFWQAGKADEIFNILIVWHVVMLWFLQQNEWHTFQKKWHEKKIVSPSLLGSQWPSFG